MKFPHHLTSQVEISPVKKKWGGGVRLMSTRTAPVCTFIGDFISFRKVSMHKCHKITCKIVHSSHEIYDIWNIYSPWPSDEYGFIFSSLTFSIVLKHLFCVDTLQVFEMILYGVDKFA